MVSVDLFTLRFLRLSSLVEMKGLDSRANYALRSFAALTVINGHSLPLLLRIPSGRILRLSPLGGDEGIRTLDPLLAGQVLSQLSYTPINRTPYFVRSLWFWVSSDPSLYRNFPRKDASFLGVSIELSSRTVARKVFSPLQSLTSVFGMGTGGPSAFVTLTFPISKNLSLFSEN